MLRPRTALVIPCLGLVLALLILAGPAAESVRAEAPSRRFNPGGIFTVVKDLHPALTPPNGFSTRPGYVPALQTFDSEKCRIILQKTAARMGWENPEIYIQDYGEGDVRCQTTISGIQNGAPTMILVIVAVQPPGTCDDCAYYCSDPGNPQNCRCLDIHGLPGWLSVVDVTGHTFLDVCDAYCNLVFKVQTAAEDGQVVDPIPVAEALYYSALEMNCCQVVEAVPPVDGPANPDDPLQSMPEPLPDDLLQPIPGDQPGDSPATNGLQATNPVVPLSGALIGTVLGWLVSVVVSNWNSLKGGLTSSAGASPTSQPSPQQPIDWDKWDEKYNPEEPAPTDEPDLKQLHSVDVSVQDAKDALLSFYSGELSPDSMARVSRLQVSILETEDFVKRYREATPPDDRDIDAASAFTNPATGEITICRPRAINGSALHEIMHVASNSRLGELTNKALDEAFTEFFTLQITNQRKIPRMTEYELKGTVDVVRQMASDYGEALLRKAYFSPGDDGPNELRQAIDSRLGPGAFRKVLQLMESDVHIKRVKALHLLQGKGMRR
jgi:hypothetical protein